MKFLAIIVGIPIGRFTLSVSHGWLRSDTFHSSYWLGSIGGVVSRGLSMKEDWVLAAIFKVCYSQ